MKLLQTTENTISVVFFLFILLGVCWSSWVCVNNFYHFEIFLVIVSSNVILLHSLFFSLSSPSETLNTPILHFFSVFYMLSLISSGFVLFCIFLVLHFQYFQLTCFKFTDAASWCVQSDVNLICCWLNANLASVLNPSLSGLCSVILQFLSSRNSFCVPTIQLGLTLTCFA